MASFETLKKRTRTSSSSDFLLIKNLRKMTLIDKEKLKEIDKIICDKLTHAGRPYTDEENRD